MFASSLFLRPLYGLAACPAKGLFPSASSIILQTRSRLHSASHSRILHATTRASTYVSTLPRIFRAGGVACIGLGVLAFVPTAHCDAPLPTIQPSTDRTPQDIPPQNAPVPVSSVNFYELTFGTVAGICAGIFIKKGAKAVAWLLGGIFVLLQYLGSASIIHVDWKRMASKFEDMFYTTDTSGSKESPTIYSVWTWIVNFLTADFQPRASFLAGLALGLRIG